MKRGREGERKRVQLSLIGKELRLQIKIAITIMLHLCLIATPTRVATHHFSLAIIQFGFSFTLPTVATLVSADVHIMNLT